MRSRRTLARPRKKSKVTIETVANRVGVSLMTVSRVLNNDGRVSDDTRQLVKQAMEDLQYRPHAYARRLAGGSSHTIGVLLCDHGRTVNGLYVYLLQGMQQALAAQGYDLMFFSPQVTDRSLQVIVKSPLIEGLVVMGAWLTPAQLLILREGDLPFVVVGRRETAGYVAPFVSPNYVQAFDAMVSRAIQASCRNIVVIMQGDQGESESTAHAMFRERLRGIEWARERYKATEPKVTILQSQTFERGYHDAASWDRLPEALILDSSDFSFGIAMGLRDREAMIPDDVRLYGFGYQPEVMERIALVLDCSIPVWTIPWERIAQLTVTRLLSAITSDEVLKVDEYVDVQESMICPPSRRAGRQKERMKS